jgi:two-component system response regulator VanR
VRVLIVEDEPYLAEAVRDGLRLEAIAADIAGDGDTALELLSISAYDIAVLDRDIPGPSGDEIAERVVASDTGTPILVLTAADRLDDKATRFGLGADNYLTKPFDLREVSALRKRLGEPAIIATVPGVGDRIATERSLSERADDTTPGTRA